MIPMFLYSCSKKKKKKSDDEENDMVFELMACDDGNIFDIFNVGN